MKSIQTILIALCFLISVVAFRSRFIYRLLAVFFFVTATTFVIVPDATTVIARRLGVGRGTDLILYIAVLAGIHAFLLLYVRTRALERKITEQIRAIAMRDAKYLQG
jgi:hypothetical protein